MPCNNLVSYAGAWSSFLFVCGLAEALCLRGEPLVLSFGKEGRGEGLPYQGRPYQARRKERSCAEALVMQQLMPLKLNALLVLAIIVNNQFSLLILSLEIRKVCVLVVESRMLGNWVYLPVSTNQQAGWIFSQQWLFSSWGWCFLFRWQKNFCCSHLCWIPFALTTWEINNLHLINLLSLDWWNNQGRCGPVDPGLME